MNQLSFKQTRNIYGPFGRSALLLFVILLAATFFETLSIGMIFPLLQMLIRPEKTIPIVSWMLQAFDKQHHLMIICLTMLILVGGKCCFTMLKRFYSSYFINNLRCYWASEIKTKYLFSRYVDVIRQKPGVLINNLLQETSFASKALRDSVDLLANALITIGVIILLLLVNWRITLIVGLIAVGSRASLLAFF